METLLSTATTFAFATWLTPGSGFQLGWIAYTSVRTPPATPTSVPRAPIETTFAQRRPSSGRPDFCAGSDDIEASYLTTSTGGGSDVTVALSGPLKTLSCLPSREKLVSLPGPPFTLSLPVPGSM